MVSGEAPVTAGAPSGLIMIVAGTSVVKVTEILSLKTRGGGSSVVTAADGAGGFCCGTFAGGCLAQATARRTATNEARNSFDIKHPWGRPWVAYWGRKRGQS